MRCAWLFLILLTSCTRGVASDLVVARDCYEVAPGQTIEVVAQAIDDEGHGVAAVDVRWFVAPSEVTIVSQQDVTAQQTVAGVGTRGTAILELALADVAAAPVSGVVVVIADHEGELLEASADVHFTDMPLCADEPE